MESVISTNPEIKSALIGGQGKFQASLLLEPYVYPKSKVEEEQYIKDIWPSVLQANRDCPAHGRIMKGFVMITDPKKPIPRAGKGTVQRHATLQLYAKEFEALYKKMQLSANTDSKLAEQRSQSMMPTTVNEVNDIDARIEKALAKLLPAALEEAIRKTLSQILFGLNGPLPVQQVVEKPTPLLTNSHTNSTTIGITSPITNGVSKEAEKPSASTPPKDVRQIIYDELSENLDMTHVTADTDLFNHGLDSLQVQSLVTTLNAYLIRSKPGVELLKAKQVYDKPTVRKIIAMVE